MALSLMYITNNLQVAKIAQQYGVERIWIDLETLGKEERQKGFDTVKSHHSVADILAIKPHLTTSKMMVRVNPWNNGSREEIDDVVAAGADIIMLPYWKTVNEVEQFIDAVGKRSKTVLLLETKEAVDCLDSILEIDGVDEIHIGLNDLHLSYGLDFMFELLTNGVVERLCEKIKKKQIPYGFGGIARIGDGAVPAEKIIMEHYRLGSTRAILSRSFCDYTKIDDLERVEELFSKNMRLLREFEVYASNAGKEVFEQNKYELSIAVNTIVNAIRKKNTGEG